MFDTTQILLTTVVTILTVILAIIGIQVVFVLKEFKATVQKMNKVLDDFGVVSGGLSKSLTGMTGLVAGLKTGLSVVNMFSKKNKEKQDE